ncbi:hypothetical protein AS9A_0540 [Hoyosella subflava DQS3-9A1]|uniref:Uncharacterized protein n=1 Tax=Hoyosella subflava (strain DSM 45089 / JCM 17490 / NBRC 109087 / DQS3-9A1) TaxID=443218 RepID=F6EIR7_HOYSD|nr:hypothetical protein AS9A_0540 [Hoyosella subflava DQS3-9A1]
MPPATHDADCSAWHGSYKVTRQPAIDARHATASPMTPPPTIARVPDLSFTVPVLPAPALSGSGLTVGAARSLSAHVP